MLYTRLINDSIDRRNVQHNAGLDLLKEGVLREYDINVDESDIIRTELGKPYFKNHPDIFFSISHCEGLAVCLISNCNCGVDAEKIRPARDSVARRIFGNHEFDMYQSKSGSDKDIYFTSLWTLKEAFAKTDGRGISVMREAEFVNSDGTSDLMHGYSFQQFRGGSYIISLCSEGDRHFEIVGENSAEFDRIFP